MSAACPDGYLGHNPLGVGVVLIDPETAAYWTGRPASTLRRWAYEGRITTYGSGRGQIRYDLAELPKAHRDEWTGELISPGATPPMADPPRRHEPLPES